LKCIPNFAGNSKISAGSHHSLVLSTTNETFSFGDNTDGQLGLKDYNMRDTPTKINLAEPIIKISSGSYHSLLLTNKNEVISFGFNNVKFRRLKL
jgi:X-linked retinitis pigmentosa GTPase regulator